MRTIGELYQEVQNSGQKLIERELPYSSDDIHIGRDLFGWRLYSEKESIPCRSQLEARYLKVFLEFGYRKVLVPENDEFLTGFVPAMEKISNKTWDIIKTYTMGIRNKKKKEKLLVEVFLELRKT